MKLAEADGARVVYAQARDNNGALSSVRYDRINLTSSP